MKTRLTKILSGIGLITPITSYAQTFRNAVSEVVQISDVVVPLLMSAALAWFIFGVVMFIQGSDNPEQRKKGKQRMLWGIIALFAMITYLSLTSVVTQSFFGTNVFLPQLFTN